MEYTIETPTLKDLGLDVTFVSNIQAAPLPELDPRLKAVYEIPKEIFTVESIKALGQFLSTTQELNYQLKVNGGSISELKTALPQLYADFVMMQPTVGFVTERLTGEEIDPSAKIFLSNASKCFQRFAKSVKEPQMLSEESMRQCQMGIDFLASGIYMAQYAPI
jgi:hypothetical protein